MPIYEFECQACLHRFERLQKLSDTDPADCPECGKDRVRRCVTAPAFRLAGSGWYETDFKKDGDKKRNLASGEEAPKPTGDAATASPATQSGTGSAAQKSAPAAPPKAPAEPGSKPAT